MEFRVHPTLQEACPGIGMSWIIYEGMTIEQSPKTLKERIEQLADQIKLYSSNESESINGWKQDLKRMNTDPSRYRVSSDALRRRILQNKGLYFVNSGVDVNNFCSLQFELPFGLYDLGSIRGHEITYRLGSSNETYETLNGKTGSTENKPVVFDSTGPFGSPIVDSIRTKTTEQTKRLLQLIYFPSNYPKHQVNHAVEFSSKLMVDINGGKVVM
jgi:DNA/RNA-binding domain of Phe-tRNA-synthetase-like protein